MARIAKTDEQRKARKALGVRIGGSPNAYSRLRITVADRIKALMPEGTYVAVDPMTATITVAPSQDDAGYLRNCLMFGWNVGDNPDDTNEWCSGSWMVDETDVIGIHIPTLCIPATDLMSPTTEEIAHAWAAVAVAQFRSVATPDDTPCGDCRGTGNDWRNSYGVCGSCRGSGVA